MINRRRTCKTLLFIILVIVILWTLKRMVSSILAPVCLRIGAGTVNSRYNGLNKTKKSRGVFIKSHGRLGNSMFKYASAFGIAKLNNMSLTILNSNRKLEAVFTISAQQVDCPETVVFTQTRVERGCCRFEVWLAQLDKDANTLVARFTQSWRYFDHVKDEIRKEFTFKDHIVRRANAVIRQLKRSFPDLMANVLFIGVHVRRGDFLDNDLQEKGYITAPRNYIISAMNYFLDVYGTNLLFIFCSDDMVWVRNNFRNISRKYNIVFHENSLFELNAPAFDLAILSMCNHTIMTTGSFGWWAGWLAGGVTVYYKRFARENSSLANEFNTYDYFYPGWIAMDENGQHNHLHIK